MVSNFMIITYAAVMLASTLFAGFLWVSYKEPILKLNLGIWISVCAGFCAQGFFHNADALGFTAYSFNLISVFYIVKACSHGLSVRFSGKETLSILLAGLLVSFILIPFHLGFTIFSLPFSLTVGYVLLQTGLRARPREGLEKSLKVFIILLSVHYVDYPFIRPNEKLAMFGFGMALMFVIALALLLPLFAMRSISLRHVLELEIKVKERTIRLEASNLDLAAANEKLGVANEALKLASSENRSLLNVLVHDIGNPLNVIQGGAQLVALKTEQSERLLWVGRINVAIKEIFSTIEHVRTFHGARIGKFAVNENVVRVHDILGTAALKFQDIASKKNVTLEIISNGTEGLSVVADADRLIHQVFGNLISNSIKFSHVGGRVEILTVLENGAVKIRVRDFGVGISDDKIGSLFDEAKPTTTFGTEGEKGMGLGLPIVKHYTRAMGGDISVLRHPDIKAGSCFEVSLRHAVGE